MPKTIIVQKGDCLINLSRQEGFFWETIWNRAENKTLRERRKHLNIIKEGDELFVPDRTIKELPRPTEKLHKFVLKGVSARFTLTLLDKGVPRANERYILTVDSGKAREGVTDEQGTLTEPIPPQARAGRLLLGEKQEEFLLDFGYVDPIDETSGVKTRLRNLGFYDGEIDDESGSEMERAIAEFQRSAKLSGEGGLTDETRAALTKTHGS